MSAAELPHERGQQAGRPVQYLDPLGVSSTELLPWVVTRRNLSRVGYACFLARKFSGIK
jgi:hypothetical protein